MGQLEGRWIAAALIPAALITVLFFFDHNVSAQLAQQVRSGLGTASSAQRTQHMVRMGASQLPAMRSCRCDRAGNRAGATRL